VTLRRPIQYANNEEREIAEAISRLICPVEVEPFEVKAAILVVSKISGWVANVWTRLPSIAAAFCAYCLEYNVGSLAAWDPEVVAAGLKVVAYKELGDATGVPVA
jgi:hypothetical protein